MLNRTREANMIATPSRPRKIEVVKKRIMINETHDEARRSTI